MLYMVRRRTILVRCRTPRRAPKSDSESRQPAGSPMTYWYKTSGRKSRSAHDWPAGDEQAGWLWQMRCPLGRSASQDCFSDTHAATPCLLVSSPRSAIPPEMVRDSSAWNAAVDTMASVDGAHWAVNKSEQLDGLRQRSSVGWPPSSASEWPGTLMSLSKMPRSPKITLGRVLCK